MSNFFRCYTPKQLHENFGIIFVHFEPFEDMEYVYEKENIDKQTMKEYIHSTIYQGYRYFFNNLENLKKFTEMAEKGELQ